MTNVYHGFTCRQSINAKNVMEFIDNFSTTITKPICIVLDNTSIHTGDRMEKPFDEWRQSGIYISFFLPSYSLHLYVAETLWRVLKTKWIKLSHYIDIHALFDATHRTLDDIGQIM